MQTPLADHSSEVSFSSLYSRKPLKVSNAPEDSGSIDIASPCSQKKKRVTFTSSISNNKRQKAFDFKENKSHSSDFLCTTPIKKVIKVEVTTAAMKTASTLKKRLSLQETPGAPVTVNRNRHAMKLFSSEKKESQAQKGGQTQNVIYGKRKVQDLEKFDKEEDVPHVRTLRSLTFKDEGEEDVQEAKEESGKKEVKKMKVFDVKKQEQPKVENMYLIAGKQMLLFPVFKESDLRFNQFIQTTLKDVDVDNDCLTDSEVMENVKEWTRDDLFKGIKGHLEEISDESAKEEDKAAKLEDIRKAIWEVTTSCDDNITSEASISGEVIHANLEGTKL